MTQSSPEPRTEIAYNSPDLALFAKCVNWKQYWSGKLRPYIRGRVIEVGAGIGTSTAYLCDRQYAEWMCMDPDPSHASHLREQIASGKLPGFCKAKCGILEDLDSDVLADTILYIDVLEHIEDDEGEMRIATSHLEPGGHVVVLSPAFNSLYSPFDKAVGHFRRYTKQDLPRLTADGLSLKRAFYLDSVGFFASMTNRMFLKSTMPTAAQLALWDRAMVPVSRLIDPLFGTAFGKTIVAIWQKD